jgi:anaerobic magnesium-protoporphyrin IX monomethyl ester cyclase
MIPNGKADVTLVNLNLLFVRYYDSVDRELHVPLGPLYLVRALEDSGWRVDFRDYQLNEFEDPFASESITRYLEDSADIVGVSCMANLLPFTLLALKDFKERHPEKTVILGGVGPAAVEEKVLERFPWIDIVVKGEAERTFPELLESLKNGRKPEGIPGVLFRENGHVVRNRKRERITDLDRIPLPAFDRVDLSKYAGYGVVTSRGCPYQCTFCGVAPIWGHTAYHRSNENILHEMRVLQELAGVELFLFQDEFFVSGKERVMSFCRALKESGMDVKWKAFGRVNLTDVEMMEAMAGCGCLELRFGIESASERILEKTEKGFTVEQVLEVIPDAVQIFPRVDAFYIWGFPFETAEDFQKTLFQMLSFRMMGARILPSLFCFLPQTKICREYGDPGKLEFCQQLLPEYMLTGHEVFRSVQISVPAKHRHIFEFIEEHPDIFPGFFQLRIQEEILPKLRMLQSFGFYASEREEPETDSCGAHSPRVAQTGGTPG